MKYGIAHGKLDTRVQHTYVYLVKFLEKLLEAFELLYACDVQCCISRECTRVIYNSVSYFSSECTYVYSMSQSLEPRHKYISFIRVPTHACAGNIKVNGPAKIKHMSANYTKLYFC